jgi:hypothetical protein
LKYEPADQYFYLMIYKYLYGAFSFKKVFLSDQITRLTLPLSDYIYFRNPVAETWQ